MDFVLVFADGPELSGQALLPPGFDSGKKYPVLVYVYGGPSSQVVSNGSLSLLGCV